jgi:D-lactate dehydrogenase (quinone)
MTSNQKKIIEQFKDIVGSKNVLTQPSKTLFYRNGFRFGKGVSLAVVMPNTILEQWLVIKACVEKKCVIIIQAANTGLTGGSTPSGKDYDREVIIINTLRIDNIHLINNGKQAISLSGATLHNLEDELQKINRTPHSVIGSSQIGATVVGGIANNSGGALVKRGPAYTEFALYAQVDKNGKLNLVNHLGIDGLGDTPEEILTSIQKGSIDCKKVLNNQSIASDVEYIDWVRDVSSNIPARFNADSRRLFEASGCAGKIGIFAVRTDTFPKPKMEQVFYLGTNNPKKLTALRKNILTNFKELPDMAEYLHRTIFNVTEKYGKDTFLAIKFLGTKRIPSFFKAKAKFEYFINKVSILPSNLTNKILYYLSNFTFQHLPDKMIEYRNNYEHHLILSVSDGGINEMQKYLDREWNECPDSGFFACTTDEGFKALLHRFAAGGAAGNYQAIHKDKVGDILALDIALRRNDEDWIDSLPKDISDNIIHPLYYGHFLCNVFHRNYLLKKGANKAKIKSEILALLDAKGAKYPAEHNVGHLYKADNNLQKFYTKLDPSNTFNPGIGKMSKYRVNCNCCS